MAHWEGNKLMHGPGKKNVYTCRGCGKKVVTVDLVEGVTPFMITCDNCSGTMLSSLYEVDQSLEPTREWYSPGKEGRAKLSKGTLGHVEKGGLLLRGVWECGRCASGGTSHGGTGDCPKMVRGPCDRFTPMPTDPTPGLDEQVTAARERHDERDGLPDAWEVRRDDLAWMSVLDGFVQALGGTRGLLTLIGDDPHARDLRRLLGERDATIEKMRTARNQVEISLTAARKRADDAEAELVETKALLREYTDDATAAMSPHPDEEHCACAGVLRARVVELEARISEVMVWAATPGIPEPKRAVAEMLGTDATTPDKEQP